MLKIVDQLGRPLDIPKYPLRIVSLVPSQTELLAYLGLTEQIVGVTKFCVHPKELKASKQIVGGTKNVSFEVIDELAPDIILCNKEENTETIVSTLAQKYVVHVSNIQTLADAYDMISQYGEIFDKKTEATNLMTKIKKEKEEFTHWIKDKKVKNVGYFIWKNPWMVAGKHTFIHHLLEMNGFVNLYDRYSRYPEIKEQDIQHPDLELILLSSEPFPFSEKHIYELQTMAPHAKIILVDGAYFSWYGSRLKDAFGYFKTLH